MRVRIESLGCRLNLGEMDSLARSLARQGHTIVAPGEPAGLCILNTCTVTGVASKKSRQALRQLRRSHPDARLVVTGCFAELSAESCSELGADLVVPNSKKDQLEKLLFEAGVLDRDQGETSTASLPQARHTRAFLKVQDGCDNHCTFCIVTLARGSGRSRPTTDIIHEILELEAAGFREVVLTGVHLGSWGHDFSPPSELSELISPILKQSSIERIRLSSLEPWDLDSAFFDLFENSRLMPHLHLPLQSGSDRILRRMARKTTADAYFRLIEIARAKIPDLAVSTDLIAGFPGETEEDFLNSLDFVRMLKFSALHVFRYSAREGTAAARMPGALDPGTISTRAKVLHGEALRCRREFQCTFLGRSLPILWETYEEEGDSLLWSGLSPNYIRVLTRTPSGVDLSNRITNTRLDRSRPAALEGSLPLGL